MESHLLSALPLFFLLASLVYAGIVGERIYTETRCISILGIAFTLLGLVLGWLLERFLPVAATIDERINFGSLGLEVKLLFSFVTVLTLLAVTIAKRDANGLSKTDTAARKSAYLLGMFVLAVAISARGKLATGLIALFLQ